MASKKHYIYWRFFLSLFISLLPLQYTGAQDLKFHHITADQGYGFGNIWSVIEDSEGFMWFASEDGLIKYDGYDIITFRNDKTDSTTISANFSVTLIEDQYHQIWIGTFGGGLNLYNRNTNTFRRFVADPENPYALPNNRVKSLFESQDGNIWVGTEGGGIVTFDPRPENIGNIKFQKFIHPNLNVSNPNLLMIRSIAEDSKGNLYIGTLDGLVIVDTSRNNITHLQKGTSYPNLLNSNSILNVFCDSNNRIWLGTLDAGIDLLLPEKKVVINYSENTSKHSLPHQEVSTIAEDMYGNLWFGTDNGLSKMDDSNEAIPPNQFNNYHYNQLNRYSLLSNSVKVIYRDRKNSLWIGTYYGGINFFNPRLQMFNPIQPKPWKEKSLSNNNVTSFAEDNSGNIWIGTDGGGLDVLHRGQISKFLFFSQVADS